MTSVNLMLVAALLSTCAAEANPMHEALQRLSASDRQQALGSSVNGAGFPCSPTGHLYLGRHTDDSHFYTVTCARGESYMVTVSPDEAGSTSVRDCDIARMFDVDCMRRFDQ